MLLVKKIIEQEQERNNKMILHYQNIIQIIPKGSIEIRSISGVKYIYFKYREGEKVVSKYYGKLCENDNIYELVDKRNHAKIILKNFLIEGVAALNPFKANLS